VNSSVGAAGTVNDDRLAFDGADGFFERALDGAQIGLHLPSVKIGAVISDDHANAARCVGNFVEERFLFARCWGLRRRDVQRIGRNLRGFHFGESIALFLACIEIRARIKS
jgi:hypothetical protein